MAYSLSFWLQMSEQITHRIQMSELQMSEPITHMDTDNYM